MIYCKKLDKNIWKICYIFANFFYLFFRKKKNLVFIISLLKFGNLAQKNLLSSKFIINLPIISRITKFPKEIFQILHMFSAKSTEIITKILGSQFFHSFLDRNSLKIFDFFFQNYSNSTDYHYHILGCFFFPQFFSKNKFVIFSKKPILVFFLSNIFSFPIESRILFFQKLCIFFLSKIPFFFCSSFIQYMLSVFLGLNNLKIDEKINLEIFKNLNFVFPSKEGLKLFLKILILKDNENFYRHKKKLIKQKKFIKKKWLVLIYLLNFSKIMFRKKKKEILLLNLSSDAFSAKIKIIKYILLRSMNLILRERNSDVFHKILKKKFKIEILLDRIRKKDVNLIKNIFSFFFREKKIENYGFIRVNIPHLGIITNKVKKSKNLIDFDFGEKMIFGPKKLRYYDFLFFFSGKMEKKNLQKIYLINLIFKFFLNYNFKKNILCFFENFLGCTSIKIEKNYIVSSIFYPFLIFYRNFVNLSWVYQTLEE